MNRKNNRRSLVQSIISLLLCVSMLMGTTLAWFSDSVSSTGNIIKSGKLDVTMEYTSNPEGEWKDASDATIFSGNYWEPGYSDLKYIKVSNTGNLAFRYQMHILPAVQPTAGDVNLSDVIDVYVGVVGEGFTAPAAFSAQMDGMSRLGTLTEVMTGTPAEGVLLPTKGAAGVLPEGTAADTGSVTYCVVLHMQETAGNEYQNLTVGNNFTIQLVATQMGYEQDSFGNTYDANADYSAVKAPNAIYNEEVTVAVDVTEEQELVEEVSLEGDDVSAEIPAGVKLADGAEALTLTVETVKAEESEANISLSSSEVTKSVDVHVKGVAEDNTVPMLITIEGILPTGLYNSNVELYHVENGETVLMTQVELAEVDAHNEYYYDAATGNVVLALASFSEIVTVADAANPWDGSTATAFAGGEGTEANPYQIANEAQFAYFRDEVDNGRTFDNEFVKLTADLNLRNVNFDPIGWGYVNAAHNRDGAAGKVFQGTFDGNGKTISNLYQNGWDLEDPDQDGQQDADYTYTNCGFGLFAAAYDATFKNLTISGANIRVECVETGILVGLSQGNCKYTDITIKNSKAANYQRPVGGLIGEVSGNGTTEITGVTIESDVVVGSMWGDFDTPVGGVIGARWDDTNSDNPAVVMENVAVKCRLDVYNDVTSSYQWYAYRRAGMLIGNTDTPPADGKHSATATANFLTCKKDSNGNETVKVYYAPWVNYHYCEFTNANESWPFVRVEAGEYCTAFSNPRWGVPNDVTGKQVTPENHPKQDYSIHKEGDDCYVELPFNQLYGGGQGIYGQPKHDGVKVVQYLYTITYINNGEVIGERHVYEDTAKPVSTANASAQAKAEAAITASNVTFKGWMNAGSTIVETIDDDNKENITLYPAYNDWYTAMFVDQKGNILDWMMFTTDQKSALVEKAEATKAMVPETDELKFDYWAVQIENQDGSHTTQTFADYTKNKTLPAYDVTIYPVYLYEGDVNLIPIDSDGDGVTNYYQVGGYSNPNGQDKVEIPASVNGIKVTEINSNAFSSYKGVYALRIPASVTTINGHILPGGTLYEGQRETVTLYYEGTPAQWKANMDALYHGNSRYTDRNSNVDNSAMTQFASNWDEGLGAGSRVFFLDQNGKVINTSYWELCRVTYGIFGLSADYIWVYHDHAYPNHGSMACAGWTSSKDNTDYVNDENGNRPDVGYWN